MNTIISLNQIIALFKAFADDHPQINSFGYGPTSDIGTSVKMDYPAFWLTHESDGNIGIGGNKTLVPEMSFTALFFDKLNQQPNVNNVNGEAVDNGQEILSDTYQMGEDLLADIIAYWSQYGISIPEDVSTFPLFDETDDKVNGFGFRLTLRLKHLNCATQIGDVRIIHPTQIHYLTCDDLEDCPTIQQIEADIIAISGSTGGLTCETLSGCTIIQDIQNDIIAISGSTGGLATGTLYGGGIIVSSYPTSGGTELLIMSLDDITTAKAWSNVTGTLIGSSSQSFTDGLSNSLAIVGQSGHTTSVAQDCLNYTGGSNTDWYLPSHGELIMILNNSYILNTVLTTPLVPYVAYQSSTEFDATRLRSVSIGITPGSITKSAITANSRAVRKVII